MSRELDWTVVAHCPDCGRPLRLVTRKDGGQFVACTNRAGCGFRTERDLAMEDLAFQFVEVCDRLERLAKIAIPLLIKRELDAP